MTERRSSADGTKKLVAFQRTCWLTEIIASPCPTVAFTDKAFAWRRMCSPALASPSVCGAAHSAVSERVGSAPPAHCESSFGLEVGFVPQLDAHSRSAEQRHSEDGRPDRDAGADGGR